MRKYKVSFWFGESKASQVVYVETKSTEKPEIIKEALAEVGSYPRTYEVMVEEAQEDDGLHFVVEIVNSEESHPKAWYNLRDGEMFVVTKNTKNEYVTCQHLGDTYTIGEIPPYYCKVVTSFTK